MVSKIDSIVTTVGMRKQRMRFFMVSGGLDC
jgi:hypothetical protein